MIAETPRPAARRASGARRPVMLGTERLIASGRLKGRRVGLVANPASVNESFAHVVERVSGERDITLAAIFGPQHGFHATLQDNMIETPHERDAPPRGCRSTRSTAKRVSRRRRCSTGWMSW